MATSGQEQVSESLPLLPSHKWTTEDVTNYFNKMKLPSTVTEAFKQHEIDGKQLLQRNWTRADISDWNSEEDFQQQLDCVLKAIGRFQGLSQYQAKTFQDPIHGPIELHPLLVKIIDTPQFQRLRDIKQLGGVYFVYPGASHNRFEHSIGVCHLAGMLVESLKHRQPELGITPQEVLCVKIAGLCHDMGHGPFSHLFEDLFIPRVMGTGKALKHEQLSIKLFRHMLKEYHLKHHFRKYGLSEQDLVFVEELICGIDNGQEIKGRPDKVFLYEIVANKLNGIDVDKMDYIARDSHGLRLHLNFDWTRYFMYARVIKAERDGCFHVCAREKEVLDFYELYRARDTLHRKAYQHKTKRAIELMIKDALSAADDFIRLPDKDGLATVKMSEAVDNMYAYTHLTDSVFQLIKLFPEEAINLLVKENDEQREEKIQQLKKARRKAQKLLRKIETRNLFKYVGSTVPVTDRKRCPTKEIGTQIVEQPVPGQIFSVQLSTNDILVEEVWFRNGIGGSDDPIGNGFFYSKHNLNKAVTIKQKQVSKMLSDVFEEVEYRVYLTNTSHDGKYRDRLKTLKKKFKKWCGVEGFEIPPGENEESTESTDGTEKEVDSSNGSGSGKSTPPTVDPPDQEPACFVAPSPPKISSTQPLLK